MKQTISARNILDGLVKDVSGVTRRSSMPLDTNIEPQLAESAYNYLLASASSSVQALQVAGAVARGIALVVLTLSLPLQTLSWPMVVLSLAPFYLGFGLSLMAWSRSVRAFISQRTGVLGWLARHYDGQDNKPALNISGILEIGAAPLTGLFLVAWMGVQSESGAPLGVVLALTVWMWTVAIQPVVDVGYYNRHPDRRFSLLSALSRWIAPGGFCALLLLSLSFQPVGYAPHGWGYLSAAFLLTPYLIAWGYDVILSCGVSAYLVSAGRYGDDRHNLAISRVHDIKKDIRTRITIAKHPETRRMLEELFPMVAELAHTTERVEQVTLEEIFDRCRRSGRWERMRSSVSFRGPQPLEPVADAYVETIRHIIDDLVDNALRFSTDKELQVIVEATFSDAKKTTHLLTIRVLDTGGGPGLIVIRTGSSLARMQQTCRTSQGDLVHTKNPAGYGTCAVATLRIPITKRDLDRSQ